MWGRECARTERGEMRKVPKMLPSYIERDAWTKLNVAPAKIMQQDNVLIELYNHTIQNGEKNNDKEETALVWDYLVACNKIFERGLLSHDKITTDDLHVIENVEEGYRYFEKWWESLDQGGDFNPTSTEERRFISWQTWDLLRVTVFGFIGLTRNFLMQNQHYYVLPLKINGSAAETLFHNSNLRLITNSHQLTIHSSMKKDLHGTSSAAHGYRDTPLYLKKKLLKRKRK
eukprot:Seg7991.1 transcript_id=Seg7991.1/GoldUCD/mRNA.D3Y31 product="hypothetical protein" protein_id=Seg7991.1/GoldUCD/D3Y31